MERPSLPIAGIPLSLIRNLAAYERLSRIHVRSGGATLRDGYPTRAELMLEADWERRLRRHLLTTYRAPVSAIGEPLRWMSYSERRDALRDFFATDGRGVAAAIALRAALRRGLERATNLGGTMGLEAIAFAAPDDAPAPWREDLPTFELEEPALTAVIDRQAERLTNPGIIETSATEVANYIEETEPDTTWNQIVGGVAAMALGRTIVRTHVIAATESVRMSRWGIALAYVGNGIKGLVHRCEWDVDVRCGSQTCPPLCGMEWPTGSIFRPLSRIPRRSRIPIHPLCRCHYEPVMEGWLPPAAIWAGLAFAAWAGEGGSIFDEEYYYDDYDEYDEYDEDDPYDPYGL